LEDKKVVVILLVAAIMVASIGRYFLSGRKMKITHPNLA